jgi:hypothetical protein
MGQAGAICIGCLVQAEYPSLFLYILYGVYNRFVTAMQANLPGVARSALPGSVQIEFGRSGKLMKNQKEFHLPQATTTGSYDCKKECIFWQDDSFKAEP